MYLDEYVQRLAKRREGIFREFSEASALEGGVPLAGLVIPLTAGGLESAHAVLRGWVRSSDGMGLDACLDCTSAVPESESYRGLLERLSRATAPASWSLRERERTALIARLARADLDDRGQG